VLASLAASRSDALLADGESHAAALTGGYHVAFLVAAVFAAAAAGLAAVSLRARAPEESGERDQAVGEPAPCNCFAVSDRRASEQVA
jgi:hypothetical protein